MEKKSTNVRVWAIFSLFVWLHSILGIYPFPWQQYAEIQVDAKQMAQLQTNRDSSNSENRTAEQWEQDLMVSTWFDWIIHVQYLLFGSLFSWLLFTNSKKWPLFIGGISIIALCQTLPDLYGLATIDGSIVDSMKVWGKLVSRHIRNGDLDSLFPVYLIWIWPLYAIVLLSISINAIRNRTDGHLEVA